MTTPCGYMMELYLQTCLGLFVCFSSVFLVLKLYTCTECYLQAIDGNNNKEEVDSNVTSTANKAQTSGARRAHDLYCHVFVYWNIPMRWKGEMGVIKWFKRYCNS